MEPDLAAALGDSPETVIPCHLLMRGLARCRVAGTLPAFDAAVVQQVEFPQEPWGFGRDPLALWVLLRDLPRWRCVTVDAPLAEPLARAIQEERAGGVRLYGDVYYGLRSPAVSCEHPWVRRLTAEDAPLIRAAPREIQGGAWPTVLAMVTEGVTAGAVVESELVAIAHVSSMTARYADIGVATLEPYRNRGLSTAATSLVAREVQAAGRTPVWSTGEDNLASRRVAAKVGFVETSRRVYVIPDEEWGREGRRA